MASLASQDRAWEQAGIMRRFPRGPRWQKRIYQIARWHANPKATPQHHTQKLRFFPLFFSNSDSNQSWFDKSHGSMINNGRKAVQTAEERHGLTLCWPWLAWEVHRKMHAAASGQRPEMVLTLVLEVPLSFHMFSSEVILHHITCIIIGWGHSTIMRLSCVFSMIRDMHATG